jgi:hypothetical protein
MEFLASIGGGDFSVSCVAGKQPALRILTKQYRDARRFRRRGVLDRLKEALKGHFARGCDPMAYLRCVDQAALAHTAVERFIAVVRN